MIKWGLSIIDWQYHAVEEFGDHPIGVYLAQCGHRLMMATQLYTEPISTRTCEDCAGSQLHDALTGLARHATTHHHLDKRNNTISLGTVAAHLVPEDECCIYATSHPILGEVRERPSNWPAFASTPR